MIIDWKIWPDATDDYVHYGVNHRTGGVVKTGGQGSSRVESLFSRLRKYLRKNNLRSKKRGQDYGLPPKEFMWRHAVRSGRSVPSR